MAESDGGGLDLESQIDGSEEAMSDDENGDTAVDFGAPEWLAPCLSTVCCAGALGLMATGAICLESEQGCGPAM